MNGTARTLIIGSRSRAARIVRIAVIATLAVIGLAGCDDDKPAAEQRVDRSALSQCTRDALDQIEEFADTVELVPWLLDVANANSQPAADGVGLIAGAPSLPEGARAFDQWRASRIYDMIVLAQAECTEDAEFWNRVEHEYGERMAPLLGGGSRASTGGDPHLSTFDGLRYDFQAVGEFVLATSTTDDLAIQVRQQPWYESRSVSANTAVAMRVSGDRVGVYAGAEPALMVNGEPTELPAGTLDLTGGGHVAFDGDTYTIAWPDGSRVQVMPLSGHLDLWLEMAGERSEALAGLLGDADGTGSNDLAARGRPPVEVDAVIADYLHGEFADSWRIDQAGSLFDYRPGEDTNTFTDRAFPYEDAAPNEHERAEAAEICAAAGVTEEPFRSSCIFDVAVTGDGAFADQAAALQQLMQERSELARVNVSTFDGLSYELGTAGEYEMLRSEAGDRMEVQARVGIDALSATRRLIYSGFAVDVAGDRLEFVPGSDHILVDGEPVTVAAGGLELPGGGRVEAGYYSYTVAWPDESYVQVTVSDERSFEVRVSITEDRIGTTSGLLGNSDDDTANDLTGTDGAVIAMPDTPDEAFQRLIDATFAASWRVAPEDSLFRS